jgi:ADP-dependent NAD(P)H-hydrate dehydratase / NAD(P)H-hydrate epimerase
VRLCPSGGAGLVTLASSVAGDVAGAVPEALTVPLPGDPGRAFEAVLQQVARADALAVGPGLGHDEATVALVRRLVREVDVPLVLDADGLNAFRGEGDVLADHASPLLVLTPHAAELTRLVGDERAYAERAERVPELARRWGAVLVAKGPGTMVAAPDGRVWVNATGSAALATGGTGDVLTGLTTALVAQRPDAEQVAAAVHLHGLAGEAAARRRTVRPVTALDVAAGIADALHHLEEHR